MDNISTGKLHTYLFFFSSIFYQIIRLLYLWGSPKWFNNLPNVSGYRFLLALGIYFICCTVFFFLQIAIVPVNGKDAFWKTFIPSFTPVAVFSVLVFYNISLQKLQIFSGIADVLAWIIILILLVVLRLKHTVKLQPLILLAWLITAGAQIILEVLFLLSFTPGYVSIILRFIIFTLCTFYTGIVLSPQSPDNIDDVTERYGLTPREKDVLCLIIKGKTNDEIATDLYISLSTVKTHITKIFEKTKVRNRLEAAALCRK